MTRVSVVIPTHNRATLLARAVESVFAQTVPVFEVIVADDNSSDGTQDLIQRLYGGRVVYRKHSEGRGGAAARNTGVAAATGDVLAFLDDDDTWLPGKVACDLRWLDRYDLVVTGVVRSGSGRADLRGGTRSIERRDLLGGFPFGGGMSNMAVRTDLARAVPFDERLPCGQDWDFLIRAVGLGRAVYVAEPMVRYNDAAHIRITNRARHLDGAALDARAAVAEKHRLLLGPDWYAFHRARFALSHLGSRRDRLRLLRTAVARYGLRPTFGVLADKARQRLKGHGHG